MYLKTGLKPNKSHWPYQGGNSTFLGEIILGHLTYKKNWKIKKWTPKI